MQETKKQVASEPFSIKKSGSVNFVDNLEKIACP